MLNGDRRRPALLAGEQREHRVEAILLGYKLQHGPEVGVGGLALREHALQAAQHLDVAAAADRTVDELVRLEASVEPRLDRALRGLAGITSRIERDGGRHVHEAREHRAQLPLPSDGRLGPLGVDAALQELPERRGSPNKLRRADEAH
eukprot:scaffold80094_cov69-Phaeocystis_antarctica.AAC.4